MEFTVLSWCGHAGAGQAGSQSLGASTPLYAVIQRHASRSSGEQPASRGGVKPWINL